MGRAEMKRMLFGTSAINVFSEMLQDCSKSRHSNPPLADAHRMKYFGLMQSYQKSGTHLFCGHWNGSPVEIGVTEILHEVPLTEQLHYHDYHEYYVILEGSGALEVNNSIVQLNTGTTVMVEPGEQHRIVDVGRAGIRWVIIKERSIPDSKHVVDSTTS